MPVSVAITLAISVAVGIRIAVALGPIQPVGVAISIVRALAHIRALFRQALWRRAGLSGGATLICPVLQGCRGCVSDTFAGGEDGLRRHILCRGGVSRRNVRILRLQHRINGGSRLERLNSRCIDCRRRSRGHVGAVGALITIALRLHLVAGGLFRRRGGFSVIAAVSLPHGRAIGLAGFAGHFALGRGRVYLRLSRDTILFDALLAGGSCINPRLGLRARC